MWHYYEYTGNDSSILVLLSMDPVVRHTEVVTISHNIAEV
jgi:hypothetical protein